MSTTDSRLAEIRDQIARLADEQRRTADEQRRAADMLQSLLYMQAFDDRSEVAYEYDAQRGYWRVSAPWKP